MSPRPTAFGPMLFAGRLSEGISLANELGFGLIELSLRSSTDIDRSSLRTQLQAAGLAVSAVATGQACLFDGLCLSSNVDSVRRATVDHVGSEIALAADLNAAIILGGIRGRLDGEAELREATRVAAVDAIASCIDVADRLGVQVLIEPINRYETNYLNTVDEVLELIATPALSAAKVLIDTFHMNIEESDYDKTIRRIGKRLGYVHIADSNRQAPGQGHIPLDSILQTLGAVGFDGPLVAEILPLPDDREAARLTASFWARRRSS